jgi:hypothetical protein
MAFACLLAAQGALAESAQEKCFPRYREAGAVPGTGFDCEFYASQADGGMGGFMCPGSPELIAEFCGGACEVEPLQPITDPDAKRFEAGDTIREDGLSDSMKDKLKCLRDKVAEKGGTLTVNSAWRPQAYQDHLRELSDKHPALIKLAILEQVAECLPAPYYGAVHPDYVKHGLNRNVAKVSNHTSGDAFDASWSGVNNIDKLAGDCGLHRPLPAPKADGGDPIHFTHKPGENEMGRFTALPLLAAASIAQAAPESLYTPEQLGLTIVADGVHVVKTDGTKIAKYTYTVSNVSGEVVRAITIGRQFDTVGKADFLLNDTAFTMNTKMVDSPAGWLGQIEQVEETTQKAVGWSPVSATDGNFGIRVGDSVTFSVRTHKAFPDLLKTSMLIPFKGFKYYETPVVQLKPLDTIAPSLSTVLKTAPAKDRPGFLKVTATQNGSDAHDPHPEILLDKIESNQQLGEKDVDAKLGTEANTFFVKQAPGRTYTVTYKALDASGNSALASNTIPASPQ